MTITMQHLIAMRYARLSGVDQLVYLLHVLRATSRGFSRIEQDQIARTYDELTKQAVSRSELRLLDRGLFMRGRPRISLTESTNLLTQLDSKMGLLKPEAAE